VILTFLALAVPLPGVLTGDWWRYYGFLQVYDWPAPPSPAATPCHGGLSLAGRRPALALGLAVALYGAFAALFEQTISVVAGVQTETLGAPAWPRRSCSGSSRR
jgi:hypothetical protein